MAFKLTEEEKELLKELKQSDGYLVLLKEIENLVLAKENDVLTTSVTINDDKSVVYRKLIAEGARLILTALIPKNK